MAKGERSPTIIIKEKDRSQVVPLVGTTSACIIGVSTRGPLNEATLVTNEQDFVDTFGKPDTTTNSASPSAGGGTSIETTSNSYYSAKGYFNHGNTLYFIRCEGDNARAATMVVDTSGSTTVPTSAGAVAGTHLLIEPDDFPLEYSDMDDLTGVEELLYISAIGTGSFYNDIDVVGINKTDWDTLNALRTSISEATSTAHEKLIGEAFYTGSASTSGIGTDGNTYTWSTSGDLSSSLLKDDVINSSTYDVDITRLGEYTREPGPETTTQFVLLVYDENDNLAEHFLCSTDPNEKDWRNESLFAKNVVNDSSNYINVFIAGDDVATGVNAVSFPKTALGGGLDDRNTLPTANMISVSDSEIANNEDFDVDLLIDPGLADVMKQQLVSIAEERKDMFVILSMPKTYTEAAYPISSMSDYVSNTLNINSNYAAIYGNYFKIYDIYINEYKWVPVAGYVAGAYVKNDRLESLWWAPAGNPRGIIENVVDVKVNPKLTRRDALYQNRINPIIKNDKGVMIYGFRTMSTSYGAFREINIRRLFIEIEKSIRDFAEDFLFLLNDVFTRSRLVTQIDHYLSLIQGKRGITDYNVICNETNNPASVVDNGELVVDIYIKPVHAIKIINLTFIATATGIEFSEIVTD